MFPGCKHVSDCSLMDCEDTEISNYARLNDFTIVTFDSDFYDISVITGHPPKIIWIRKGNLTTGEIIELIMRKKGSIIMFIAHDAYKDISCLEID
jgi:predicted nuclease of predicted toxin-antitoxin system